MNCFKKKDVYGLFLSCFDIEFSKKGNLDFKKRSEKRFLEIKKSTKTATFKNAETSDVKFILLETILTSNSL